MNPKSIKSKLPRCSWQAALTHLRYMRKSARLLSHMTHKSPPSPKIIKHNVVQILRTKKVATLQQDKLNP